MTVLAFSMTGEPRGKGRPRATVREVGGGRPIATIYTDARTRSYEASVAKIAKTKMVGAKPLEGPLSVSMRFRLSVPVSYSKRLRAAILAGEEAYLGAFDIDNLAKSILDGLNGVVFRDDKQVTRLFVEKLAAEQPGVDVRVESYAPQASE